MTKPRAPKANSSELPCWFCSNFATFQRNGSSCCICRVLNRTYSDHHDEAVISIGIAIQNFPEGAIISMPLRSEGMGKKPKPCRRSPVRDRRTHRCSPDNPCRRTHRPGTSLSSKFRQSHAPRSSRRTHPRNVCRRIQYRGTAFLLQ